VPGLSTLYASPLGVFCASAGGALTSSGGGMSSGLRGGVGGTAGGGVAAGVDLTGSEISVLLQAAITAASPPMTTKRVMFMAPL